MIDLSQIRFGVEKGVLVTEIKAAVMLTNSATISNEDIRKAENPELLFEKAKEALKQSLWEHVYGELRQAWLDGKQQELERLLTYPNSQV